MKPKIASLEAPVICHGGEKTYWWTCQYRGLTTRNLCRVKWLSRTSIPLLGAEQFWSYPWRDGSISLKMQRPVLLCKSKPFQAHIFHSSTTDLLYLPRSGREGLCCCMVCLCVSLELKQHRQPPAPRSIQPIPAVQRPHLPASLKLPEWPAWLIDLRWVPGSRRQCIDSNTEICRKLLPAEARAELIGPVQAVEGPMRIWSLKVARRSLLHVCKIGAFVVCFGWCAVWMSLEFIGAGGWSKQGGLANRNLYGMFTVLL